MSDTRDIMLDIEALGLRPGFAVVEIGAIVFDPWTGLIQPEQFHARLKVSPYDEVDPDTVAWHAKQGTWPPAEGVREFLPPLALCDFTGWLAGRGKIGSVWSWGATYDFPLLAEAYRRHLGEALPWKYYQSQCARTIWNLAFPGIKHAPRPHNALADCVAAAGDLHAALMTLTGRDVE